MANPIVQNPVFVDPVAEFDAIPQKGEYRTDFSYFDTGIGAHIQGMGYYGGYFLFTHNREKSEGYWGIGEPDGDLKRFDFPEFGDYRHPGGFQVIGDYAVSGIERSESNNNEGLVVLFDLRPVKEGKGPTFLPWGLVSRKNGGAACVGVAKVDSHYVLAVYTSKDGMVHIYKSNDKPLSDPALNFGNELFAFGVSVDGKGVGYDNLNLYTDEKGALYMIGMRGESSGSSFADYMELIAIDVAGHTHRVLRSRHMTTENHQGITGPHFRYGAGTALAGPLPGHGQSVFLFCSGRLFMAFPTKTQMNFFASDKSGSFLNAK